MKRTPTDKKNTLRDVAIAAAISIMIGTFFLRLATHTGDIPLKSYLWNAGYSVCLGLSLFANGMIFNIVERKYISWRDYPVRSVFIALAVHFSYSTFIIFIWNWLWFIVLRGESVSHFLCLLYTSEAETVPNS